MVWSSGEVAREAGRRRRGRSKSGKEEGGGGATDRQAFLKGAPWFAYSRGENGNGKK